MNDFTKEELECIFEEVNHLDADRCKFTTNLLNKIQSMIDSYCEHKHTEFVRYDRNKRMIRYDHIALYERLSSIAIVNHDYQDWLRDLRSDIVNQQSEELRVIE